MSEHETTSVLRRKAKAGHQQYKARAMTAARALRLSLAKAAEDELEVALATIGLTEAVEDVETALGAVDDMLMMVLETPGRGPGAALMDPVLVGALVQQVTMGSVTELREGAPPRLPTRTDSALIAPLLDEVFRKACLLPDTDEDVQLLTGIRFGAHIAEKRLLETSIQGPAYRRFSLTRDIASGKRQGKLDLLLPLLTASALPEQDLEPEIKPEAATLEPVIMELQADLRVALCRLRFSFQQLADLHPGDVIDLPPGVMGNALVLTKAGRQISQGKLGQLAGRRALRLTPPGTIYDTPRRRSGDGAAPFDDAGGGGVPPTDAVAENSASADPMASLLQASASPAPLGVDDIPDLSAVDVASVGLPEPGDLPDLPDIPGIDSPSVDVSEALPELPDLPELLDLPAMGALPDLPDLPDLPELPMAKDA